MRLGLGPAGLLTLLHHAAAGGADLLGDLLTGCLGICLLDLLGNQLALLHGPLLALLPNVDHVLVPVLEVEVWPEALAGSEVSPGQLQRIARLLSLAAAAEHGARGDGDCNLVAFLLNDHLADGLVLLHLVLFVPGLTHGLIVCLTHRLPLARGLVVAHLLQRLIADLDILLKHHRPVADPAVLVKACLALPLLGGHVVGDEGVVALLAELVGALHLLLINRFLHLHHLVDAPEVVTVVLALLPGAQLRLCGVLVGLRISTGVLAHGVSKLVEQSIRLRLPTTLSQLSRLGRLWFRKLLLELSWIIVVELLLVVILLLVVVEFLRLLLLELIALLLLVV